MNYKEAKEIIDYGKECYTSFEIEKAKGFIEAVEKFKPIFEKLTNNHCKCENPHQHASIYKSDYCEALESYRREVLGEKDE